MMASDQKIQLGNTIIDSFSYWRKLLEKGFASSRSSFIKTCPKCGCDKINQRWGNSHWEFCGYTRRGCDHLLESNPLMNNHIHSTCTNCGYVLIEEPLDLQK